MLSTTCDADVIPLAPLRQCSPLFLQGLHHPHIVGLMDILEIDNNTFATLLDYCEGQDLDTTLRENQVREPALGERAGTG